MKPRKFVKLAMATKMGEKIEALQTPPIRTEWYETKSYIIPDEDTPRDKRYIEPRYTYYFKCPFCKKVRQLRESNNLECGKAVCKCGSSFRVVVDEKQCPQCYYLMECLATGIAPVKRKKLCELWVIT